MSLKTKLSNLERELQPKKVQFLMASCIENGRYTMEHKKKEFGPDTKICVVNTGVPCGEACSEGEGPCFE